MEAKSKQIRKPRTYKAADSKYNKARRRARKENGSLAGLIENLVIAYANGYDIKLVSPIPNVE